jgi:hypothetical protein
MVRIGSASLRGSTLRFASGARHEILAMSLASSALARRHLPLGFAQALARLAFALRTGIGVLSSGLARTPRPNCSVKRTADWKLRYDRSIAAAAAYLKRYSAWEGYESIHRFHKQQCPSFYARWSRDFGRR